MLMYCVCWRENKPEKVVFTTDLSRWDYTCQGRPPSCWDNFGEVLCIRGSQTAWPTSWTWIGAQSFGWVYHLSRFCLLWYFNRLSGCQVCSAVFFKHCGMRKWKTLHDLRRGSIHVSRSGVTRLCAQLCIQDYTNMFPAISSTFST